MKRFFAFSKYVAIVLALSFTLTSCAAIFHGSSDYVNFTSEPPACGVYVNGQHMGETPIELKLKSSRSYVVEFKKDGYDIKTYQLTNGFAAGYLVLDIVLGGGIALVVDAATQSWYTLDDDAVHVNLEKAK